MDFLLIAALLSLAGSAVARSLDALGTWCLLVLAFWVLLLAWGITYAATH